MKHRFRLSEYGTSKALELSGHQLKALEAFKGQLVVLAGSKPGEYHIQASQWVGEILIPGLVISIEPKIGAADLLQLMILGDGEALPRSVESLVKKKSTLWDLLAETLISEVSELQSTGLSKNYIEDEGNLLYPAGQILFQNDLIANFPVRSGVYCRTMVFTENISCNQALKWALSSLALLTSDHIAERLLRASDRLEAVEGTASCPSFNLPLRSDRYFLAMYLVSLFQRASAVVTGLYGQEAQGFLLDMNKVFEGYVRAQLRRVLVGRGLSVPEKHSDDRKLCDGRVGLQPDILIFKSGGESPIAIADAKYKREWDFEPSDVYQMLAYLEGYLPVQKAIILYPTRHPALRIDSHPMPRSRNLVAVGIPANRLLDNDMWNELSRALDVLMMDLPTQAV